MTTPAVRLFDPLSLRGVALRNRIVVSPMCQYSADEGRATDWHLVHWGQLLQSGGVSPKQKIVLGAGYQVPFARAIRRATGMTTMAVGLITDARHADEIIAAGDADLVALARAMLWDPRWPWRAAATLGGTVNGPQPYWRGLPKEAATVFGDARIRQR